MAKPPTKLANFLKMLDRGDFTGSALAVVGVARRAGDGMALSFSPGTLCQQWIDIPEAAILDVDQMGTVDFGGETCPVIKLTLNAPDSDEGRLFAALLAAVLKAPPAAMPHVAAVAAAAASTPTGFPAPPGGCPAGYYLWQDPITGARWCRPG